MTVQIACTECGVKIKAPEKAIGKRVKCPKCKMPFVAVPLEDANASTTPPPATEEPAKSEPIPEPVPTPEPEPAAADPTPEPIPEPVASEPEPIPEPEPTPEPVAVEPEPTPEPILDPDPVADAAAQVDVDPIEPIPAIDSNAGHAVANTGAEAIAPAAAAATPAVDEWTMRTPDGNDYGPITKAELDGWVAESRVDAECQLMDANTGVFVPAGNVYPHLADPLNAIPTAAEQVGSPDFQTGDVGDPASDFPDLDFGDPVGSAVDAVADAGGAVVDGVGNAIGGVADGIGNVVGGATDAVGGALEGVADGIGGAVGGAGDALGAVGEGIGNVVEGATDAVGGALGGIADGIGGTVDGVGDALGGVGEGIGNVVSGAADAVGNTASGALAAVAGGAGAVVAAGAGAAALAGGAVSDAAAAVNPYDTPSAAGATAASSFTGGGFPDELGKAMSGTRPWTMTVGVMLVLGAIGSGLMAILSALGGIKDSGQMMPAFGGGAMMLVVAGIYGLLAKNLFSFSSACKSFAAKPNMECLTKAMNSQKSFWRICAMLIILMGVIVAGLLAIAIVTGYLGQVAKFMKN